MLALFKTKKEKKIAIARRGNIVSKFAEFYHEAVK